MRCSPADGLPTLALPSLAGSAGEAVGGAALSFLTAQTPKVKRKEKQIVVRRQHLDQARVVWEVNECAQSGNPLTLEISWTLSSGAFSSKRKKKNRRHWTTLLPHPWTGRRLEE